MLGDLWDGLGTRIEKRGPRRSDTLQDKGKMNTQETYD